MSEQHLPDRRKHGYKELEEKLEAHVNRIDERFQKRYRGMLVAFSIIGLTSALALAGFGILLDRQGKQQEQLQEQTDQIEKLAKANTQLSLDIQEQRRTSIRDTCEATNQRNEDATNALIKGAGEDIKNAETEAQKDEIRRRRDVTLGLIALISPKTDCDERVDEAVQPVDPEVGVP